MVTVPNFVLITATKPATQYLHICELACCYFFFSFENLAYGRIWKPNNHVWPKGRELFSLILTLFNAGRLSAN
jgi:hypothetical protein